MHGFKIKEPLKGELQKKAVTAKIKVQLPSEDDPEMQGGRC